MADKPVSLCIIDDIDTVVKGIERKIPWEEHGIVIAGTATNGEEGLELIRKTNPQIILTDIRMPKRSGIDMLKAAVDEKGNLTAKVIFLSGYTDFSYAQESIRLGAFDYLLKPFTPKQILDVVLRAKRELESEMLQTANQIELEQKVRESMPYLRQEYFRLMLRCVTTPENAEKKWEFLNIDMDRQGFIVMVAEIDRFASDFQALPVGEVELIRYAVQNILEETVRLHTKGIIFREHVHQFVGVLNVRGGVDIDLLMEQCRNNVEQYAKRTVSIGIGARAEEIGQISVSFEQARTALSYHFYSGGNCVIHFRDIERQGGISPRYHADNETELLYCLRSGNREAAERQLNEIFEECFRYPSPPDPDMLINLFYGLAFSMFRVISETIDEQDRLKLEQKLAALKSKQSASVHELKATLTEICITGCELMQSRQKNDSRQLIVEAVAYIKRHLASELTVQECANVVHLSPSYFSNLFKKETGSTFMQFVTAARMDRAKELLLQGVQVQEVTYELGYKDRPYFSELFKKHTGRTPTEFRQQYEALTGER